MRSGELRHRITLQSRSTAKDSFGGQVDIWTDVLPVWACIKPLSGRELMAAQAVQSETTHSIEIRYNPLFGDPETVTSLRALYGTRIFNITGSINEDERNRMLTLSAKEGLNHG